MRALFTFFAAATLLGCAGPGSHTPTPRGPYVVVLGTAQDAGLPQIGCLEERCVRARKHPQERRLVTSLLLADPRTGKRWLFDATPDIREQVSRAAPHPPTRSFSGPRPPLFDGLFLTHAHMGHYTGLLHLGPEAYGAKDLPVYVSARFDTFLRQNGPWSLLVDAGVIRPEEILQDERITLGENLHVRALVVPHRDEFTDTLAFIIEGPRESLLYLPDIDKWERWSTPIEEVLSRVDHALIDGAFYSADEIPGRDLSEIPHPLITESLARFAPLPVSERRKVLFTHLNHTNPACDRGSPADLEIGNAGMGVARDGIIFEL
jgi:pyrroloquinoline quinone biosynthesis protein B